MALAAAGVEFDFAEPDREVMKSDLDQYPFGQVPRWVLGGCWGGTCALLWDARGHRDAGSSNVAAPCRNRPHPTPPLSAQVH